MKHAGGRPPKPTALHKLHNTKSRRDRTREPVPVGDLGGPPPEWFSEGQGEAWAYCLAHSPPGLLRKLDRGLLVVWCLAEDQVRYATIAQNRLNANTNAPGLVNGPEGLQVSPFLEIIERASKIMLRCQGPLGFSPAARPSIRIAPDPKSPEQAAADAETDPWGYLEVIQGGRT